MNTNPIQLTPVPARHPLNVELQPGEKERLHSQLIQPLLAGLIEGGASFIHVRAGKPFRLDGVFHFHLGGLRWSLRLLTYNRLRWIWRLTIGFPELPATLTRQSELTVCIDEVNAELGRGVASMLHALARGEKPVWPLFGNFASFPHYAWSAGCQANYDEWYQWDEARRRNRVGTNGSKGHSLQP